MVIYPTMSAMSFIEYDLHTLSPLLGADAYSLKHIAKLFRMIGYKLINDL